MKKILLLAIIILYSCEHEIGELNEVDFTRSSDNIESNDGSYSFAKVTDPAIWRTYNNLEEMLEACQLPKEVLESISTENLIETCMNHPLFYIYSAYNNEFDGVNVLLDNFNGFQELVKRESVGEKIVNYYVAIDVDEIASAAGSEKVKNSKQSILRLGFLELVMTSDRISSLFTSKDLNRMEEERKKKTEAKLNHTDIFSIFSLKKDLLLKALVQLKENNNDEERKMLQNFISNGGEISSDYLSFFDVLNENKTRSTSHILLYTINVYTKFGRSVTGYICNEMTSAEITEMNDVFIQENPNATFLGNSSYTYNCHSYAWNMKDGGTTCWINCGSSITDVSNLSKYWDVDYYGSTTANAAVKIHYYNSDHSAIASVNGMYESKWGRGPLMRHAPGYGPYLNMSNRNYYAKEYYNGSVNDNNVYGLTTVGAINYYSVLPVPSGSNVVGSWQVFNGKGEEEGFTATPSGLGITVVFHRTGPFEIYYNVFLNTGEQVGHYGNAPFVLP